MVPGTGAIYKDPVINVHQHPEVLKSLRHGFVDNLADATRQAFREQGRKVSDEGLELVKRVIYEFKTLRDKEIEENRGYLTYDDIKTARAKVNCFMDEYATTKLRPPYQLDFDMVHYFGSLCSLHCWYHRNPGLKRYN